MSTPEPERLDPTEGAAPAPTDPGRGAPPVWSPLRDLLATYDREVEASLRAATDADSGLARVRILHNALGRSIAVHDAILVAALCPMLERLPDGEAVAERLRRGCEERAVLLEEFDEVSRGVAAPNVYPVSGEVVERVLAGLRRSFTAHAEDETTRVGDVMEAAAASTDPDTLGALMALEARLAPTRTRVDMLRHPGSSLRKTIYRSVDRGHEWVDSHHGWTEPSALDASPRVAQVQELKRQAALPHPTVRGLLAAYDATIDQTIEGFVGAKGPLEKAEAAHRLSAAIALHDSVVGGTLCPLLGGVPGGEPLARALREECGQRAELQQAWTGFSADIAPEDLFERHEAEATARIAPLIESFQSHEREESLDVASLLETIPEESFRTMASPFEDAMWPWHGQGPALLAVRMAGWAKSAPSRAHPALVRHPSSRVLRSFFHLTDHFQDHWKDSALERWVFPHLPTRPFSGRGSGSRQMR